MPDGRMIRDAGDFICLARERERERERDGERVSRQETPSQCGRADSPGLGSIFSDGVCQKCVKRVNSLVG